MPVFDGLALSASRPFLTSTDEPNGTEPAAARSTNDFAPGTFTRTVPDTGRTTTVLPNTGWSAPTGVARISPLVTHTASPM